MKIRIEVIVRDDGGHVIDPPWILVGENDTLMKHILATDNGWLYEIEVPDERQ